MMFSVHAVALLIKCRRHSFAQGIASPRPPPIFSCTLKHAWCAAPAGGTISCSLEAETSMIADSLTFDIVLEDGTGHTLQMHPADRIVKQPMQIKSATSQGTGAVLALFNNDTIVRSAPVALMPFPSPAPPPLVPSLPPIIPIPAPAAGKPLLAPIPSESPPSAFNGPVPVPSEPPAPAS